jgi:hypothetical protein
VRCNRVSNLILQEMNKTAQIYALERGTRRHPKAAGTEKRIVGRSVIHARRLPRVGAAPDPRLGKHWSILTILWRHWTLRRPPKPGNCLSSMVGGVAAARAMAGRARIRVAFILTGFLGSE